MICSGVFGGEQLLSSVLIVGVFKGEKQQANFNLKLLWLMPMGLVIFHLH
jgi:hypothetical protein